MNVTKLAPDMSGNPAAVAECRRRGWPISLRAISDAARLLGVEAFVPASPAAVRAVGEMIGLTARAWPATATSDGTTGASTSSAAAAPAPAPATARSALDMTDAELRVFEREHGISR